VVANFLNGLTHWELWRIIQSGNQMYEMKSDNIVEGIFSWMKEERALGSAYFFVKAIFLKYIKMQEILYGTAQAAKDSPRTRITPRAQVLFDQNNMRISKNSHIATIQCQNPLRGAVVAAMGNSNRQNSYNVDFARKVSKCTQCLLPKYIYNTYPKYINHIYPRYIYNRYPRYIYNRYPRYIYHRYPRYIYHRYPRYIYHRYPR
jgi:hypothetical protein